MTDKYINLFTDFGFKKIFGEEPNKDLLIHFLNELLVGKEKIKDLTYLKNERLGKRTDRKAVYDLFCENDKGEKFIVEVQRVKQEFFKDRSIYYSSFAIQEQAQRGRTWQYELKAVYTIAILDFEFSDTRKNKLYHKIQLLDVETYDIFYHKLTYIYLEVPKFTKSLDELENDFERWLYAFKNLHKLKDKPEKLQDGIFLRLMQLAEIAKFTKKEQTDYQESLKIYWDLNSSLNTAFKEGKEAGKQEGLLEGKREIAQSMLKKAFDVQTIAEITGLSVAQVESIKSDS